MEGVCTQVSRISAALDLCPDFLLIQTITVLRQAWLDRLRPILVINKVDRLVTELKLAPIEAYHHLSQLIEQVNAVMGSFFASERMEDDLRWREARDRRLAERKEKAADEGEDAATTNAANQLDDEAFEEKDDEDIYFSPERGNVIFASAIDGWGFRIGKFAQLYAAKLGVKEANLRRVLWGDFYLDPKTKRIISYKHLRGRTLKPLFVQFILDNIWAVYENVVMNPSAASFLPTHLSMLNSRSFLFFHKEPGQSGEDRADSKPEDPTQRPQVKRHPPSAVPRLLSMASDIDLHLPGRCRCRPSAFLRTTSARTEDAAPRYAFRRPKGHTSQEQTRGGPLQLPRGPERVRRRIRQQDVRCPQARFART